MQATRESTAVDSSDGGTSTVLRYRGAWWVRQSWCEARYLVEIRVKRISPGRVLLVGPMVSDRTSVRLDTDRSAAAVADALLEWLSLQADHRVAAASWQEFARLLGTAWLPGVRLAESFDHGLRTSPPARTDRRGVLAAARAAGNSIPSPTPHPPRPRSALTP